LVFSIDDSTEAVIQRKVEAIQRFIKVSSEADDRTLIINPAAKKHFELQIRTLQNAPRDVDKLERLLKIKERQNDKARQIEDTEWVVTEIEMLKLVLYLVSRSTRQDHSSFATNLYDPH
jgi:hypothetical protein